MEINSLMDFEAARVEFLFEAKGVEVFIKRDDLLHPTISGNKGRKLKYFWQEYQAGDYHSILSFGGAHSNHLAALAALGKLTQTPCHALIRGEEEMDNPTLRFCRDQGMQLEGISRAKYRQKDDPDFRAMLLEIDPQIFIIPEGGKGPQGVAGCAEITQEFAAEEFDYFALAAGTGTTAAGVLASFPGRTLVYSALKGGAFLKRAIVEAYLAYAERYQKRASLIKAQENLILREDYHFGGYAKINQSLVDFMNGIYQQYQLRLDPVYTAKALFGLQQDIEAGFFAVGTRILFLHSGGLQGIEAMQENLRRKGLKPLDYD